MACDISKGRLVGCKTVAGLKSISFINYAEGIYGDLEINVTTELVEGTSSGNITMYKYDLRGANTMDETGETNGDNNTAFWSASGSLTLASQDAVTRKELKLLSYGRPIVITEGWDGVFKLYGAQNGCNVSVNTNSGSGLGDFNGYTLTISASEKEPAFIVDSAIIDDGINFTTVEGV
jgi:hypothetical protein